MSNAIPGSAKADVETLRKDPLRVSFALKNRKLSSKLSIRGKMQMGFTVMTL